MPTAALIGPLSVRREGMMRNISGIWRRWRWNCIRSKDAFICAEDVLIFYPAELRAESEQ